MGGQAPGEQDDGSFSIDIDDDLLAAAMSAVEQRMSTPTTDAEESSGDDLELLDDDSEDDGEALDIEFDLGDLDEEADFDFGSQAEAVNREVSMHEAELSLLSERIATLEAQLDAAADENKRLTSRLSGFARERRRQQNHLRMVEERITRMEQQRQRLMDERDEAIQGAQQNTRERDRLRTDLQRQRERLRREQQDRRQSGAGPIVLELLPAIDNLELAMGYADADAERVVQGLGMILQQLHHGLHRGGVVRVRGDRGDAFDPEVHEAIHEEPAPGIPEGYIARVVSAGYRFEGRLLRPARVIIAAPRAEPEPLDGSGEDPASSDEVDVLENQDLEAEAPDEEPSDAAPPPVAEPETPTDAAISTDIDSVHHD